ncbi:exo-beta-N-acetylmuramidase NamZ domain-containing protein [Acidobacteriota bacterium]
MKKIFARKIFQRPAKLVPAFALLSCIWIVALFSCKTEQKNPLLQRQVKVKTGLEVFLESHLDLIKDKKVGLITNPTGTDSNLDITVELFHRNPDINLVALYGPEHGVRGNAQAGEYVPFYFDEKYNIPSFSLYGQSMKPAKGMRQNIDAYMRSFDINQIGKIPQNIMVEDLDVLIFDIQDVGTRIYTYIATLAFAMQACAENGIAFIVLDRPNPINGVDMEGPILEFPEFSSFVGLYPIPVRHGMTVGELAKYFNDNFFDIKANLTVIPMKNWKREMWFDDTGIPWIIPSPNMPTLNTATVYPGQVFLEGTNLSEGRGTTKPFELFGAPWIDGYELARELNALHLPGIKFREAWFTPTFSKYKEELCGGTQIHITDRKKYKPFEASLYIIKSVMSLYSEQFEFHSEYFDKIIGNSKTRDALKKGHEIKDIISNYRHELEEFYQVRELFLLY